MSVVGPVVRPTGIPGLLVVELAVHGDARGWFKENWQREKMVGAGLPDFSPVQHSVAWNGPAGVTRGIHAEPWDKLVSVAHGRVFGAWVDLREGPTFGAVHTQELDERTAVFVPRGVGNAYQTLTPGVVYSYLVNDHWSPHAAYTMLSLADETVGIDWPVPPEQAQISEKDRSHPRLAEVVPVAPRPVLVLGAGGQLGKALLAGLPHAVGVTRSELDLSDPAAVAALDLSSYTAVVNAAAFTAVDAAETGPGRAAAWATNAAGVAALARAALAQGCTLVHYSSDYVFDGTASGAGGYAEHAPLAPSGVYGQTKAAGDLAVSVLPRHYLLRTSWVVGAGNNFVRTMSRLAAEGACPRVVADQVGRLTFTDELVRATEHLLASGAPYGTYNVTNGGQPASWAEVARRVFTHCGRSEEDVSAVSTADYERGAAGPVSPRPARSLLDLSRLHATGFASNDQWAALEAYLERERVTGIEPA